MTDPKQTPQVDKWLISEPGGPAGPLWGIVTQSGRVIALQIVERQHAEETGPDYPVLDIGVDCCNFSPINLGTVSDRMNWWGRNP